MTASPAPGPARQVGRYAIYDPIATGGMATVHLGRLIGPVGFARTVAIKRLHPQYARDPEFVSMFLDEARLAARIQHPNVVPTIDVIATDGELLLVMEYVRGETLSRLIRAEKHRGDRIKPKVVAAILANALQGLHAAHEATDDAGQSLGIVHRDVSPQNVIVGVDGVARVLDFGVAKAEDRIQVTKDQKVKGKLLYMSPEQLESRSVDRRTDVYAMGIILFEALTGERMFTADTEAGKLLAITRNEIRLPSEIDASLAPFDAIVKKASAFEPKERYATAREMAKALEAVVAPASTTDVGEWVQSVAGDTILERAKRVAELESVNRLGGDALRDALNEELRNSSRSDVHSLAPPDTEVAPIGASRVPIAIMLAAIVLVLGGGAAYYALHGRAPVVPAAVSTPVVQTVYEIVTAPPMHSGSVAPPIAPEPSSSVAAIKPSATVTAVTPPHRPAGSASSKPADCEQPYVVDWAGHMHFRKECL